MVWKAEVTRGGGQSACWLGQLTTLRKRGKVHEGPGTQVDVGGCQGAGGLEILGATRIPDAQAEEWCGVHLKPSTIVTGPWGPAWRRGAG